MHRLTMHLLGPMSVVLRSNQHISLGYDKVRAFLAYLVIEHERPHSRERLAGLLWPEQSESAARHSLSQALSTLRKSIDDRSAGPAHLLVNRDTVQFNVASDCWVDHVQFHQFITDSEQHTHGDSESCAACAWRLERALNLNRGIPLEGLSIPESEAFDDWLRTLRQQHERVLDQTLRSLIGYSERTGQLMHACNLSKQLVEMDRLDETAHRTLMRLLAASGKRSAAIQQYEDCRAALMDEVGLEPEDETIELYDRIRAGLDGPTSYESSHFRPVPARPALPNLVTPFVGRDRELEQVADLLTGATTRLATLTGPGGIGKTRLAIRAAESVASRFPDGVHFVSLAGLSSPSFLASAILDALSLPIQGESVPSRHLLAHLQRREMLLVLDNMEHLRDDALLIAEMIESAPGLRVLTTSRERLNLTGEWIFEVEGLSLPANGTPQAIAESSAAQLFLQHARKQKSAFTADHDDAPAIARICQLTGGMPLGLELSAAWIPVLSCWEIADEIERSLDFLASPMQDIPERHRSIRAVFDRSWEHLSETEQRAFRRLAAFRGGFLRAAAEYVSGASLPVLSALVGKSLLRRDENGRYEIHELLRQFAEAKLQETEPELDTVLNRHRDYYIGFLAVRQDQMEGREQEAVLKEIGAETENVRAAWQRAIESADLAGLGRAAHSLWLFFEITGRYQEGAGAMEAALGAVRMETSESLHEWDANTRLTLARILSRYAALSFRLEGPDVIRECVTEAHSIVRELDDPGELGILLNYMACASHVDEDYEQEEVYLEESIEQSARAGHRWTLGYSQNDLGQLRMLQGDYTSARELHQTSLATFEELGDRRGTAFALRNLGVVANHLGDRDLALALLRRSVEVRQSIDNRWGVADSLTQIGIVYRDLGELDEARSHFHEALRISREAQAMQLAGEIIAKYGPLIATEMDAPLTSELQSLLPDAPQGRIPAGAAQLTRMVDLLLTERTETGTLNGG